MQNSRTRSKYLFQKISMHILNKTLYFSNFTTPEKQTQFYTHRYTHTLRGRDSFIMYQLTCLQKMKSPIIQHLQVGDTGKPMVYFSLSLRTWRANGVISNLRAEENWCSSSNSQAQKANYLFLYFFALDRPSVDQMMSTHTREGNLLQTICRLKC